MSIIRHFLKKNRTIVSGYRWFKKNMAGGLNGLVYHIIFRGDVYRLVCSSFPDGLKQRYLWMNKNRNRNIFYTKKIRISPAQKKDFFDFIMCLDLSDEAEINYLTEYGTDLTALMKRVLDEGDIFVDIGAHVGYFSLVGAFLGARVLAFEPERLNYSKICFNAAINNFFKKIDIFNLALSDRAGQIELTVNPINKGGHNVNELPKNFFYDYYRKMGYGVKNDEKRMVDVDTLDNIIKKSGLKQTIKLIKIDAEGHEEHVLKGMAGLLSSHPPPYLFIEDKFIGWKIYADFLKKYNYQVRFFKGDKISEKEEERTNYSDVVFALAS